MANNVYEMVTDRIIEKLEQGEIPWKKSWTSNNIAVSRSSGKAYGIINQIMLDCGGEYATFNAIKKMGGKVKKGSKAKQIIEWKMLDVAVKDSEGNAVLDDNGKPKTRKQPMLKFVNVFNIENDTEGLELKYITPTEYNDDNERMEELDRIVEDYCTRANVRVREEKDSNSAYYMPSCHSVTVPQLQQFTGTAEFYGTLFHELGHSTGHPTLLNRPMGDKFGSKGYAKEELIAELTSCAILNKVGLETEDTFENNAAYIQSWLKALKDDKTLLVNASANADKAVNLILNIQK